MNLHIKTFDELTTRELYEILMARMKIFVVEQRCTYLDMDGVDYDSLHFYYEEDGKVLAYLRAFVKPGEPSVMQVGRVLTIARGTGLGRKLLEECVRVLSAKQSVNKIFMEAQSYAIGFYEKCGFKVVSEEFLEDNIPHVEMELEVK